MDVQNFRVPTLIHSQEAQPTQSSVRQYTTETASTQRNRPQSLKVSTKLLLDEEPYRSLLENLPCVVYRCIHDEFWTAEFVSDGCEQITGYPAADFIYNHKRSLISLIAPADRTRVCKQIDYAVAQGQPYNVEYRVIQANGQERWVAECGQGVAAENDTYRWRVGAFFDISTQKQTEEALVRTNGDLQENARLIGEFLANVSHEIRTPLSVILTIGESLQEGIYGPASNRQVNALERLRRSGRHLLGLVNDILDVAKVEVGKLTLQMGRTAAAAVCSHSLQMVQDAAAAKNISLQSINRASEAVLWADEQRLQQILINLLTNAVKFTPAGGQVGIEVETDQAHEVLHFTVWDTGIGIAREETPKLFRPFVQLDTKLARQYEGAGLGLALVYHLVRLHGGGIVLETEVGQGSRFTVSLPWHETAGSTVAPPANSPPVGLEIAGAPPGNPDQPRLLILQEPTAETARLIAYLQAHHLHVVTATDEGAAVTLASEQQPHLIVLDVDMPDFSLLKTIQRLRAAVVWPKTPVIVMTTLTVPGHQALWQQAALTACLTKPVSPSQFLALVQTVIPSNGKFDKRG